MSVKEATAGIDTDGILTKNPFRYRGYYYDSETGFYATGARYYDPQIGRFISADNLIASVGSSVQGHNLFAYCENDPVNKVDPAGHFASEIWEFARIAGYEISANMGALTPAYAGCVGVAAVDGPLPIGDVICIVGVATLTVGAVGYGVYQATQDPSISFSKAQKRLERGLKR